MPNREITARSSCREISYPSRQGEEMSEATVQRIQVGSVHPEWVEGIGESIIFIPRPGHFIISQKVVTENDLRDFRDKGRFGFVRHEGIVVFLLDLGPNNRIPMPYLGDPKCECCSFEDTNPGDHRLLSFSLVESETGIVRGLRAATLSSYVTDQLQRAVRQQPGSGIPQSELGRFYDSFHRKFPSWSVLMRQAVSGRLGD